jgi:hypothetical protein
MPSNTVMPLYVLFVYDTILYSSVAAIKRDRSTSKQLYSQKNYSNKKILWLTQGLCPTFSCMVVVVVDWINCIFMALYMFEFKIDGLSLPGLQLAEILFQRFFLANANTSQSQI